MSLDLNKLENKLDEALSNETSETLSKFLNDKRMTNNKQLSLIDALCILRTGYKTQQESELSDHAYLVIKQHSERLHLEYQRQCIDEKLNAIKEDDKQ